MLWFKAYVRNRNGGIFEVKLQAPDWNTAKMMFEAQYGRDALPTGVFPV